jgi:SNF2 family DNA or RNA helicase
MTLTYFRSDMTRAVVRKEFRRLSLLLHPDKGGDEEMFKAMREEYGRVIKTFPDEPDLPKREDDPEVLKEVSRRFDFLETLLARNEIKLMKPHQDEGVKWLMKRELEGIGGLLCDEMGLGKTMQMCSLIVGMPKKMTLLVVPPVIIGQWLECLASVMKVTDRPFRVLVFKSKSRAEIYKELLQSLRGEGEVPDTHYVVISSYQMLLPRNKYTRSSDCQPRLGFVWDRVILDEVHYVRNPSSKAFGTVNNIRCRGPRWGLTGTPINNRTSDVQAILQTVLRKPVLDMFHRGDALREVIADSILRRTKDKVVLKKPLPKCDMVNVLIPFESQAELDLYTKISTNTLKELDVRNIEEIEHMTCAVFEQLMRMRQVTTDPNMAIKAVNKKWFKRHPLPEWCATPTPRFPKFQKCPFGSDIGNISKMNYLLRDLDGDKSRMETSLIFCHFRGEMSQYETVLKRYGYRVGRIDGSVSALKKEDLLGNFQCSKYDLAEILEKKIGFASTSYENADITNRIFRHMSYDILLIQIDCGGTGLNLQAATRIYLTSPHYNPAIELQAIARSHRIGQKRKVVIKKLLMAVKDHLTPEDEEATEETIDTQIVNIQNRKIALMERVLQDPTYKVPSRVEVSWK